MTPTPDSPKSKSAPPIPSPAKRFKRLAAIWLRWLHIYASMFGLAVTLFFSATGITLNHSNWFGEAEHSSSAEGSLKPEWVKYNKPAENEHDNQTNQAPPDELAGVARLEVVEHLRTTHKVRGALAEFNGDDRECMVTFKGPGYAADAVIDRATGMYKLTQTSHGLVAVLNDLHKGRDSGPGWSILIDISAVILCLISITGLGLIFFLKLRLKPGLLIAVAGTVVTIAIYYLFVP
jgi:hypothetical protein